MANNIKKKTKKKKSLVKSVAKAEYKALKKADKKQIKVQAFDLKNKERFANTDATSWRSIIDNASNKKVASKEMISEFAATLNNKQNVENKYSAASQDLLSLSSKLLAIATGIALLFGLAMFYLPGGQEAVVAMGGVLEATAPLQTAQIVFLLDILFPITFGAGFALLATAFQSRGNRPIVRVLLTALLVAILADFSENALVFKMLSGSEALVIQWPLTVVKYAMLGFSAVLLSALIDRKGWMGQISTLFLRYAFPLSIAFLVSGIGGRTSADIVGATFLLGLLILSIYATLRSSRV